MEEKTKQDLVGFLKRSTNVFAQSHEDMLGIDLSVITHYLNVYPSSMPVQQKKRMFPAERDNAIKEKVQKLTTTSLFERFIIQTGWPMQ